MRYASEAGLGVMVMGPLAGGKIAQRKGSARRKDGGESPAAVALRFVLRNESVSVALSGMSAIGQVEENCAIAGESGGADLGEDERVARLAESNEGLSELYCTACEYCLPCPSGVDIPGVFQCAIDRRARGSEGEALANYKSIEAIGAGPSACSRCGECERKCPQGIRIRDQLAKARANFSQEDKYEIN